MPSRAFRFPGRTPGLVFLLTTQMIPAGMLLLPLFIMIAKLKMINTPTGLLIAYSVTTLPLTIWTLKGYYDIIPVDLEEAAMIDGCSRFGALMRVSLPIALPGLAATAILCFLYCWTEFLYAVILTGNRQITL